MPRQISFAKTVAQFLDGSKTVTRREGWRELRRAPLLGKASQLLSIWLMWYQAAFATIAEKP